MYLFDKNEELINVISPEDLLENEQTQELNGLITTVVSAPFSKELENAFYIGSRDIDDNNIFWLYKIDKRTKEDSNLTLHGTYVLFDELKAYDLIRDKRPTNATAVVGISAVLEGCRWQVGDVTSTHKGTANWYYVSRLEAFWEFLENWNVEFKPRMTFSKGKITGRYIDIVDKLSNDYGKWYEYGDKLLQVTAEQNSDSLYTAFIGRGKGEEVGDGYGRRIGFNDVVWSVGAGHPVDKPIGQDYVEIPQATDLYGYSDGKPRTTVVTFEDTEDATLLLEQTYEYALNECRPKLQMKADVLETGLSELGETCTIIRDDIGIRYKTRVFKLTRDFLNKNKKTVEFGDEIVKSTAKRNSNVAKAIKKQEQQTIGWLESLHLQLQDTYFNEDGYNYDLKADNEYDLPGGFYSFNAPIDQNPTKLIYMGAGSLAIANSKNPDGSWDFRTWGTGDGFTADLMNAGTIDTNLLNVFGGDANEYVRIEGAGVKLRGEYTRTWNGVIETASTTTYLQNGYATFENIAGNRTLSISDFGISSGFEGGGSGAIEFFSNKHGMRGITVTSAGALDLSSTEGETYINSLYKTAIRSSKSAIWFRPQSDIPSKQGDNAWSMGVADGTPSQAHGYFIYGSEAAGSSTGIGFSKDASNPEIWMLGANEQRASVKVYAGEFRASKFMDYNGNYELYMNGRGAASFENNYALMGNGIMTTTSDSAFYVGTENEVRITNRYGHNSGGSLVYKPISASAFNVASSKEYKKNIENYEGIALDIINSTPVREYNMLNDVEGVDYKQIGLIVQESPLEIINMNKGDSINTYAMQALMWKAIQEMSVKINELQQP